MDLRQFKLSGGEEVMCEVVEFHEEEDAIVVRKALKLYAIESMNPSGVRFFAFRPYMMYQLEPEAFQIIQCSHIMAEAAPSKDLINEYFISLEGLTSDNNEDDVKKTAEKKARQYMSNQEGLDSSELGNIISFPGPSDKIH